MLNVGPQIVKPSQPTTLSTSLQTFKYPQTKRENPSRKTQKNTQKPKLEIENPKKNPKKP